MKNLENILKSRDITLLTKVHIVKAVVFPVVMYGWESWIIKKAECWRIGASKLWCWNPLDSKEIKPLNPKGNQSWIFTGRTDAGAEAPILGPSDAKSWFIGKDPNAGKDWKQEKKGVTWDDWDEVGWHHWLNGHEFEQTLGDSEEQGSLVCCMQSIGSQRVGHNLMTEQQQAKDILSIQKLEEPRTNSPLEPSGSSDPPDSLTSDFWPSELWWQNKFILS